MQENCKPFLLPQIAPEQSGFILGRGTRDVEKCYEFNVPAVFCFLDYSKAFDTAILTGMGVPEDLILLMRNLYVEM